MFQFPEEFGASAWEGIWCSGWEFFHTDFGAIAVVPKFRCNESVDASGATDGFFQSGHDGDLKNFSAMDLSMRPVQCMDFFQLDLELILA